MNCRVLIASLLVLLLCAACSAKKPFSYSAELDEFDYPNTVYTYKLNSQRQKLKMRYMDVGAKTSPVAVLLHGKNFSGYYWEKIIERLEKLGYRVVAPDQIGFGKSSKPEQYQYTFAQLAHNTHELLASLDITEYVLVGHSMGGMLATHMASLYPESVEKLVLINPIGLESYLSYVEFKDPQFFFQAEVNKTVDAFRAYQQKNYYDGAWKESYESLLTPFKGWRNGPDWERVAWNNALTYSPIFTEEITTKFPQLNLPIHLIIGTRDKTGPGRNWKRKGVKRTLGQYQNLGKDVVADMKNGTLHELPGLGHMPQFEDYDAFSRVFYPLFD